MADVFARLRHQLESVERWLGYYMERDLSMKERQLAETLLEYVHHCLGDEEKWRSESKAEDAIFKVNSVWIKLYKPNLRKD